MVETAGAIKSLDEIASVPGLAGLLAGPVDLGLALERPYPLPADDPIWSAALDSVVRVSELHGIRAAMYATDAEEARHWFAVGFRDVLISSDISMLRRAMFEQHARARQPVSATDPLQSPNTADPYAGR